MSADNFDEDFTDYERKILANIDEHGCHVTYVFGTEDEPDHVPFAYSTGFTHTLDQGEVIVFGLSQKLMHSMVNRTMRQCRDDGMMLEDGLHISGLLEGFDVVARLIPSANIVRENFNSAMWHHVGRYGTPLTEAYQLVWPGAQQGLFPWDAGCDEFVISQQPALYEESLH